MKRRISPKVLLIIMILAGILLTVTLVTQDNSNAQSISEIRTASAGLTSNIGQNQIVEIPKQINIPAIGIDARVESVGLTMTGAVDVPKGPMDAAWYDLGPRPGEIGSAVIVGHMGWRHGIPAMFDKLINIRVGDKIYVKDENGNISVFVVVKSKVYGENDDASQVFHSNDGKIHLNLITCSGDWNKEKQSYSDRLVIFADRSPES